MVAIKKFKINEFIASCDKNVDGILIYGPNEGLCSEIKNSLIERILGEKEDRSFSLAVLEEDTVKAEPTIISSELQAVSLLGERRVVVIQNSGDAIAKHIKNALMRKDDKSILVIQTGILTPRSKVRAMFEKEMRLASIPCYEDDENTLARILSDTLSKENISINLSTRRAIVSRLSKDRRQTRTQLEKLILLAGESKSLSEEQVLQILEHPDALISDTIIDTIFEGKKKKLAELYNTHSFYDNNLDIGFIRIINSHINRLKTLRRLIDEGKNIKEAMNLISPKFFFKREQSIKKQCELLYSQAKLNHALINLIDLELRIKQNTSIPAHVLVQRMTITLSSLALHGKK